MNKAPSTRIRFRLKTQKFFSVFASRPHVSDENGHRKRKLLKTLSKVETFENYVFAFSCGHLGSIFSRLREVLVASPSRAKMKRSFTVHKELSLLRNFARKQYFSLWKFPSKYQEGRVKHQIRSKVRKILTCQQQNIDPEGVLK